MEEMRMEYDMIMMDDVGATPNIEPTVKQTVRSFFPETWLWDIQFTE